MNSWQSSPRDEASERLLTGGLDDEGRPLDLHVLGGTICCHKRNHASNLAQVTAADGLTLLPAVVDIHLHGAGGIAVLPAGETENDVTSTVERLKTISRSLGKMGTAAYVASIHATAPEAIQIVSLAAASLREASPASATLLGVHLEGPYLSPHAAGAHPKHYLRTPEQYPLGSLLEDFGIGQPLIITIAPELPGAIETIRECRAIGIIPSIGHTIATAEQVVTAIQAGAQLATHYGNAMGVFHQRSPGAMGAILAHRLPVELIASRFMLHPDVWRLALLALGQERVILVSDGMPSMGMTIERAHKMAYEFAGTSVLDNGHGQVLRRADHRVWGNSIPLRELANQAQVELRLTMTQKREISSTNAAKLLNVKGYGELTPGSPASLDAVDAHSNPMFRLINGAIT